MSGPEFNDKNKSCNELNVATVGLKLFFQIELSPIDIQVILFC